MQRRKKSVPVDESSLINLMENLMVTKYDVDSYHWVLVTHINQPDNFFVRPIAYETHLKTLEIPDEPLKASKRTPRAIVTFKSKKKSKFIRGRICDLQEEEGQPMCCKLLALDYGFTEVVPVENLHSTKHGLVPGLAMLCQLADCYPKSETFDDQAVEAMVYYVGQERARMIVKGRTPTKLIVQLINTCPEDISTMLSLTEYTTLGYGANDVSRMPRVVQPKLFFTYKQVKVGDTIKVRVQSGDTLDSFYVCDVQDYADHVAEYEGVRMYLKHQKTLADDQLTIGKPVAVYNCRKFERGIITHTGGSSRPVAQLVDWGKRVEITADSQPKALDKECFFERPALAIYCSSQDSSWYNGLSKFLYPGYTFMIKIKKCGRDHKSQNIVNIFKI